MNASQAPLRLPADLHNVLTLASLLERLEHSLEPVSPEQYRSVAARLAVALGEVGAASGRKVGPVEARQVLNAILAAHPDAAQVYENLHYQHAGLCLSSLDDALRAELQAREAIARAAGRTSGQAAPEPSQG